MSSTIRTKPHHFIDIITAFGHGQREFQPHPYGHDVHGVATRALVDREVMLEMELGADDICVPCTHNINGLCDDTIDTSFRPDAPESKREWNLLIDERWCERLDIAQGDRMTAREFCERVRDRMGNITDIYREIPVDRTAKRAAALQKGLDFFLTGA